MAGRLLADGARLFFQAGVVLLLAVALGAEIATGVPGALLILLIGTLIGIVTFGVLTAGSRSRARTPRRFRRSFRWRSADLPDERL